MTNLEDNRVFTKASRKRRFAAFTIDYLLFTCLAILIFFIALGSDFINQNNPSKIVITILSIALPGFVLFLLKDSFKGISVGRWIMGIMVRDENNFDKIPSFDRLFLRNLLLVIAPFEALALASSNNKRRIGDKVSRTAVVANPNESKKFLKVPALIGIGVLFFSLVLLSVGSVIKNSDAYRIATEEIRRDKNVIMETGGVKGFGIMPTANISIVNGRGQAYLEIKVLGNIKNLKVGAYLKKEPSEQWKLVEIRK